VRYGIELTAVQNLVQATVALVDERFSLLTGQLTVNFRFARDPAVMAQIRAQRNDSTVTMKVCPEQSRVARRWPLLETHHLRINELVPAEHTQGT
jgi:hypothetical protein